MSVIECEELRCTQPPQMLEGDLAEDAVARARELGIVALDIETTGLDWHYHRIGTVQVQIGEETYIVRANGHVPAHLKEVVEDPGVRKVLHHAMFDLAFLAHQWQIAPANVACTKIASKLAEPERPREEHSLAPLLARHLGVRIDKSQQCSDWSGELSADQLQYAANDVRYLVSLYQHLDQKLREEGRDGLRERCYSQLPTQVELAVGDYPDIFKY
jgi:ribonuclease D